MTYSKVILFTFICVLAIDVFNQINPLIGMPTWGTSLLAVLTFISGFCLVLVSIKIKWKNTIPARALLVLLLFWLWSLITFVRGVVNAQDYWDWKVLLLVYLPSVLVSLAIVPGLNFKKNTKTFRFVLYKLFPISFIFIHFSLAYNSEFYARLVMPVSLFVLLVPYLKMRWRILVIAVAITSINMDLSYRANAIRILIPLLLIFAFHFRYLLRSKILNATLAVLFFLPIVLLYLGVNGTFNVFSKNDLDYKVHEVSYGKAHITSLSRDTRTFLYQEVFYSMLERNSSLLIGQGAASGYQSEAFANSVLTDKGRYRSEVGFLNTLLYSGIIGVLLYASMLFVPAYYAINKSNNYLCKLLGLYLAARWVLFFVADISMFDMNYYFLWLTIGLSLSNRFRTMTNSEIRQYFNFGRSKPIRFKMITSIDGFDDKPAVTNKLGKLPS